VLRTIGRLILDGRMAEPVRWPRTRLVARLGFVFAGLAFVNVAIGIVDRSGYRVALGTAQVLIASVWLASVGAEMTGDGVLLPGLRWRRRLVRWADIAEVKTSRWRPPDLALHDGSVLEVKGAPPEAAEEIRARWLAAVEAPER
jgi:hypothetical protein